MATKRGWFIFDGTNSMDMGIVVTAMPDISWATREMEKVTIPGRDGELFVDEGTYTAYDMSIYLAVKDKHRFDEVAAWLTGGGELILSSEKDKVYRAFIANGIAVSHMNKRFQRFMVTFRVQPFKYSRNAISDTLTLTAPATIYNRGTIYSTPIITIYGTGDMDFTINGTSFGLTDVVDSITVNCEIEEVYKDGVGCNLQYIGSAFPRLDVGGNAITWTGNVEKVEVEPQWRWR